MTSADAPFVTVLMPVFNAERWLAQSIQSILRQEFSDFELLIVNDGSTDGSTAVARSFSDSRIRLLELPQNIGFVEALNRGLAEARGIWIARQDGDDFSHASRLREQVNLLMVHPEIDLLYSDAMLIDEGGMFRGMLRAPENDALLRWDLCFRNSIPHSSVVFRRDSVTGDLRGYRYDNVAADYDLWTRILKSGHAMKSPGTLVHYRLHSHSIMGTENASAEKKSAQFLQNIMRENITRIPGDSENPADFQILLDAWTTDEPQDWHEYFTQRGKLLRRFDPQHSSLHGMKSLLSQEDYTLFHRILRRSRTDAMAFLQTLLIDNDGSAIHLPWAKVAYSFLAR